MRNFENGSAQTFIVPERALLLEHDLPVVVAQRHAIAMAVEIDELLACAVLLLTREIRELVTEGRSAGVMSRSERSQ
jgi:hypothetical protein